MDKKNIERAIAASNEVFESWEEMAEPGALDKRLNSIKINSLDNLEDPESPRLTTNENRKMIILKADGMPSRCTAPEPTVKILRRPVKSSDTLDGSMNGNKPKQPIKSLKQREQEYAEARKRILGEETSPEERTGQEQINVVQSKVTPETSASNAANVLRMPKGPDGTRGFKERR